MLLLNQVIESTLFVTTLFSIINPVTFGAGVIIGIACIAVIFFKKIRFNWKKRRNAKNTK